MTKPTTKPLTGKRLAAAALKQIIEHPETWNQIYYHSNDNGCYSYTGCGTKHCFHGWCQKLIGLPETTPVLYAARKALGITLEHAEHLVRPENTLDDLKRLCREIFGIKTIRLDSGKVVKL